MSCFNELLPTWEIPVRKPRGVVGWYRMWIVRGRSVIGKEIRYPFDLPKVAGCWVAKAMSNGGHR